MSARPHGDKQLSVEIHNLVEGFLTKFNRGSQYFANSQQSISVAAARDCARVLREVVDLFQRSESDPNSLSNQSLRQNIISAAEVSKKQVEFLLLYVTRAGAAMQRGPQRLLLTNTTRRILSILRESAAESHETEAELEKKAKELVESLPEEEEDSDDFDMIDDRMDEAFDDDKPPTASPTRRLGGLKGMEGMRSSPSGMMPSRTVTFGSSVQKTASMPIPVNASSQPDEDTSIVGSKDSNNFLARSPIKPGSTLTRAPSVLGVEDTAVTVQYQVDFSKFVERATAGIMEFEMELENASQELSKKASRQLHDLDTVVTLGGSHSTTNFLLRAAEDGVRFKVVVLEGSPLKGAARLAEMLRGKGLDVRTLPDSSAFAVMSTCTKVIIGVENVLANGGLLAPIGTHPLCIAARCFSVPVIVVTMTLKMTPYYPSDAHCTSLVKISRSEAEEQPWSTFAFPGSVLPVAEQFDATDRSDNRIYCPNPQMEYVPPNLVSLFATNAGEYTVPQIHRIVKDNYNPEDSAL